MIKHARKATWAIGILCLAGAISLGLRLALSTRGGIPAGDSVWTIRLSGEVRAHQQGAVLRIAVPADTTHIRVFGQDVSVPGFRLQRTSKTGEREISALAARKGEASINAEFDLHLSATGWKAIKPKRLTTADRDALLQSEPTIQSGSEPVAQALASLRDAGQTKPQLLAAIADFCSSRIELDREVTGEDAIAALSDLRSDSLGRARAMVALCRAAKIPARIVRGIRLRNDPDMRVHSWVEVLQKDAWISFDPENEFEGDLPADYVPMLRANAGLLRLSEGEIAGLRVVVSRAPTAKGVLAAGEKNPLQVFDLTRLPLATQASLAILLMLPFGALLTTFCRNFVGIRTFGTFSPTMLALAAVYADWRTVVIIFVAVILIGFGGRSFLPGFKLMQVPRLSIVFTLVAISMMLAVSLLDFFGLNPTGSVALLPMVVLANMVDRVYNVLDEDGPKVAMVRLGWTSVVAFLCFWLMLWDSLGRLVVAFPEVHFFSIAGMLLIGLYSGKKLSQLRFFGFLEEPKGRTKPKKKPPAIAEDYSI